MSARTDVARTTVAAIPAEAAPSAIVQAVAHLEQGDWKSAHALVQKETGALGFWAHGLVHLMEGDLENARYWYRRARRPLPHANTAIAEIAALKASAAGE